MNERKTAHTQMWLVYILDALILNTCIIFIAYACLWAFDWLWGMVLCNFAIAVTLRAYLFKILQIHWLASPLNRAIKRLIDIASAITFLASIFPIILFVHIIYNLATKKKHETPIFTVRKILVTEEKEALAVFFSQHLWDKHTFLNKTPWAFNIFVGTFSLWDLKNVTEIEESNITEIEESIESVPDEGPNELDEPNINDKEEDLELNSDITTDIFYTESQK